MSSAVQGGWAFGGKKIVGGKKIINSVWDGLASAEVLIR